MMHKLFTSVYFAFLVLIIACTGPANKPKDAAKAFFEAVVKKDYDKAAQYATNDSKTLLEFIKASSELGSQLKFAISTDDPEKLKSAVYTDTKIEGDKAFVNVSNGSESIDVKLKKEDGVWKVALDKDTFMEAASENSGKDLNDMKATMHEALKKMNEIPMDSLQKMMDKAGQMIKSDTLKQALEKAGEMMKKAGEAMQEASKEIKN